MSAATDAVLEQFRADVDATTDNIAADIDKLIADAANGGATVEELTAALGPISAKLKAVAEKVA
jgi:cytochrome c556